MARRLSICSTVSSVSVIEDQASETIHPWTTFENHIKAINLNEVQFETKTIGRPASTDFQKALHDFQVNEVLVENKHDYDASLSEDIDVRPAAIANDLTTGARTTLQRLAKRSYYVRGPRELDLVARGNLCVKGQVPRHLDQLTKGRSCSVKVGKMVPDEDSRRPTSESVWNRTTSTTMGNTDCGIHKNAWKPVQQDRKRKEQTVDERMRRELYERYLERPNSWMEGFVTDSGRRIVEELVKERGLENDVKGRGRGRRINVDAMRKEDTQRKKE